MLPTPNVSDRLIFLFPRPTVFQPLTSQEWIKAAFHAENQIADGSGDMDIWVNRTSENYSKLVKAFFQFGLSVFDMTEKNFLDVESADVFSFGRPPVSIDILTRLKGVEFGDAYSRALQFDENGLIVRFIQLNNLIDAKKASGRYKDLDDIEKLSPGTDS